MAKPKLLLLHGWTLNHTSMQSQEAYFSRWFEVINPDRPGHGQSDMLPKLPVEHLHWLRQFNEPVHIMGISQGARIGLRMLATDPHKVASLVVHGVAVDGLQYDGEKIPIPLNFYIDMIRSGLIEQFRQTWLAHPMMSAGMLNNEQTRHIEAILADYRGVDLMHDSGVDFTFAMNLQEALAAVDRPVLVSTGSLEEEERQYHSRWLAQHLSNADFVCIENGGHLANFSHAEHFNANIEQFYRSKGIL